ncbi:acyl-CoA synthetase family member 2 [Arctopsyche grandis]|uniref:acyl-CoA synthetase family member 2 n=1 Tax=Arctopsyche grandis TaxID=121162 RepID=UPI00406D7E2B
MTSPRISLIFRSLLGQRTISKKNDWISKRVFSSSPLLSNNSDLSYIHHVGEQPLKYTTIGQCLEEAANIWPDRPWITSCHEGTTLTFSQVFEQADMLAAGLIECGLQPGDRIGIASPNYSRWIVSMMAAARAGLILVPINPVYTESELEFTLKKVSVKGLIMPKEYKDHKYYEMIRNMSPELDRSKPGSLQSSRLPDLKLIVIMDNHKLPGTYTYDDIQSMVNSTTMRNVSELQKVIQSDNACNIQFTSGTTGKPKGALLSHYNFVNNSYLIGKRNELSEKYHKICVQVPLFHAYGLVIVVMASLQHGSTMILPSPMYSPNESLKSIINEKCTFITGTPTMYVDLVHTQKSSGIDFKTPEIALIGGSLCSPILFEQAKKVLNVSKVKSVYGMTETSAVVFQSLYNENLRQATETVGHIQEHTEAKVVDEKGNIVPFGTPGELCIRGYCNMLGYWNDSEKTSEMISPDKWLRTGDQFILQKDGYGKIVGRLKDMIIRGGENVFPKEIEDFISTHPDVAECHVFGVKDDRLGEEICATVRAKEGSNFDYDQMKRYCQDKISNFKIPRYLKIVDDFPKTASGKIQKFKLKEMFENDQL